MYFSTISGWQMRHKCYQNYKGASTQSLICREGQTDGRTDELKKMSSIILTMPSEGAFFAWWVTIISMYFPSTASVKLAAGHWWLFKQVTFLWETFPWLLWTLHPVLIPWSAGRGGKGGRYQVDPGAGPGWRETPDTGGGGGHKTGWQFTE